jgi:threonine dehydratase
LLEKNNKLDLGKEAFTAEQRIRTFIWPTPLEYSPYLSKIGNCNVFLKLENMQRSGSFKFRGAANHVLSLNPEEVKRGMMTSSTGNHGAAFAEILEILNYKGTICLPENASPGKLRALKHYNNVRLKFYGTDCQETENYARETARVENNVYIPPYNHPKIIAGQATIALEIMKQIDKFDAVLVPVGGGGLMSGVAGFLKSVNRLIQCVGCLPQNSPVMYESVKAGRIVDIESLPTLSDATAGGLESGAITFDICREYVDQFLLISEEEIASSIKLILQHHYMLIEGGAALPVAAFLKSKEQYEGKTVILIITGKKITLDKLKEII